jgi:hypothetical protein
MEHVDPMLQAAWEENLKLAEAVERLRHDLSEARKCLADIAAILKEDHRSTILCVMVRERLNEYAGT